MRHRFVLVVLLSCSMLAACQSLPQPVKVDFAEPQPQAYNTPAPRTATGSLFQSGSYRPTFEDRRARNVGDTLTIQITENVTASQKSTSTANRTSSNSSGITALPGVNFPAGSGPLGGIGANSASDFAGKGGTESANTFIGSITATVSEVLPNGHLVVVGEKQIGVNQNVDVLRFSGKQLESLFMRELIKSMREATMKSGMLDSAQGDLGQDLLDQQFASQMSGRPGGLSDLIAQQLTRQSAAAAPQVSTHKATAVQANATPSASSKSPASLKQSGFVQQHDAVAMSLAIGTKINDQQALGFDLNGQAGQAMFKMASMPPGFAATTNTGSAKMSVALQTQPSGVPELVASDYEVLFTSPTDVTVTRVSDGKTTPFNLAQGQAMALDGLSFAIDTSAGPAQIGDRFVLKPLDGVADSMFVGFSSPRGLAMSSPVGATAHANNQGTLAIDKVVTRSLPVPPAVTLTFTNAGQYIRSDDTNLPPTFHDYAPGQAIEYSTPAGNGWTLTLQGSPMAGDVIVVRPNTSSDGGNAQNMLDLRDSVTFDGGPMIDGYASLIANIGTRVQSAQSAAEVSTNIAVNLEKDRSGVAGVNLDEEAAKMLQYQQAYQASGKMLQVAQNLFDTLIQSVAR